MTEITLSVRLEIGRPQLRDEFKNILSAIPGVRIRKPDSPEDCDILIKEIGEDPESEFPHIRSLRESGLVRDIFLTAAAADPDVLIRAMRAGAREFFTQPVKADEVKQAIGRTLKLKIQEGVRTGGQKLGRILDVIGSKGGVGATTVAVNLAAGLNSLEGVDSVALVDMNLLFGEVPLFLSIEPAFNWGEVARNISRLDLTYLMGILSKHPSGIHVLPSPTGLDGVSVANPEIIERILVLMQTEFDYIVIDSGQSLDSISLKILELSDTLLLVSTLSLPCLINLRRLLETFASLGYPGEERIRIIMNRHHKKSVITRKEAEKALGKDISWLIPNDYQTAMSALNQGKLLTEVAGRAEITRNFSQLAAEVKDVIDNGGGKGGGR